MMTSEFSQFTAQCCGRALAQFGRVDPLACMPLAPRALGSRLRSAGLVVDLVRAESIEDLVQIIEAGYSALLFVDLGVMNDDVDLVAADQGINHSILVNLVELGGPLGLEWVEVWDAFSGGLIRLDPALLVACWLAPGGYILSLRDPDLGSKLRQERPS